MASREPMWFCHECEAEMRPMMMPDPHCERCNSTFVEKIENTDDDPRQYHQHAGGGPEGNGEAFDPLDFLMNLSAMVAEGPPPPTGARPRDRPRSPQFTTNSSNFSIRIDRTGDGPTRTVFTSNRTPPTRSDSIPPIFGAAGGTRNREDADITGPLMFQYLAALLAGPGGRNGAGGPFAQMFGPGQEPGRMGDYVFSQQALDEIMTQLMENSTSRPVPATEDIMQKLPKTVLEDGSPLLEKDCAVCKDPFQLGTEDPAEQCADTSSYHNHTTMDPVKVHPGVLVHRGLTTAATHHALPFLGLAALVALTPIPPLVKVLTTPVLAPVCSGI
ncbi:hypothetical protein EIP91_004265 [Steccherinum ochraceum]|uniref:RING-type E3 ubiquitin transferase n=1 Tax=Steccherinum ochraceum TaxID=92696 RepID=A0A4R0RKJ5_9APHY|nr:hypothetical protein EIP91_004265 [Steccherinum ochraceum]